MATSLGSGAVDYRPDRPVLHFATPPEQFTQRREEDRLRARGFLFDAIEKEMK